MRVPLLANIHSVITYNANLSPAQAQIKALTGQVAGLSAAFNTLDKSAMAAQTRLASTFMANVGQIGGFTSQLVQMNSAVETFGKNIANQRLTMRQYFREAIAGYTKQHSLMKQLAAQQVAFQQSTVVPMAGGRAAVVTPAAVSALGNSVAMASQKFSIFNELIQGGSTRLLNFGKNTQWTGRQLMVGFTVPLAMFTALVSKQFRDLDKELTRFEKVYGADLANTVKDSTRMMRQEVQQLAFDIARTYGIAAKDTAALAADIAATGKEGEALLASVQQTTRLSVLGEVDRQEAMKATLAIQSAFKQNTNELAESINFLNAVENQTSTTLQDLSAAIPRVGPIVRSLGGDIEDLAMMLVAMREGGVPAAEAANAIKSGLASLINPTKKASEVARQFGVDLVGIVEANRGQLMPTIYAVQQALSGLDSFSRSRIIEEIFGKYQFARMTALFDNIGKAGSQTQAVLELASKSSVELAAIANKELKTLTESTAMRFQRTLEELRSTLIPLGEVLTETLIPIFQTIGSGIKAFSDFFSALPEPVKNFTKYAVAIAALAGPIVMLVGLFGNLIANGIKFGMAIVRLGARIAGLRFEKFELLDANVMAAKLGVDNLTTSFVTQEKAVGRLAGALVAYENSLRRLASSNPAYFIPGAVPARGTVPIRRQSGSSRPEFVPGSGRGDKIPALLEPGEFIVNRSATQKYAHVLLAMNRGTVKGFARGMQRDDLSLRNVSSEEAYKAPTTVARNFPLGEGMARGHIFGTPTGGGTYAFGKRLRLNNEDIMWHQTFWKELSIAENSLSVTIAGSARNQQALRQSLASVTKDQDQIERIMERATLGFIQHQDDLAVYKKAVDRAAGLVGTTGMPISARNLPGTVSPGFAKDISSVSAMPLARLTGFNNAEAKAVELKLIEYYRTLMGIPGQLAKDARIAFAKTITQVREELRVEGVALAKMPKELSDSVKRHAKMASPSRLMDEDGKGLVDGLNQGVRSRSKQTRDAGVETANEFLMGAKSVNGRVGGTMGGIESISNAQKIAQADQSILRLKTIQQKHIAERVRAEVELGVLDARLTQIRNSETMTAQEKLRATLALNQERIALEKIHQNALANETRIQNTINGYKQRIADADQAQLKAEQEEARNAQRRAAMSFGMGPGGSMGYFMGGGSPFAPPKPTSGGTTFLGMPAMPAKTGPGAALSGAQNAATGGGRGNAIMNASFMASMLVSSMAMMGGASSDAAAKLGLFTTALMTATMAAQMFAGKNVAGNFLGMKSLGGKMLGSGAASRAASMGGVAAAARGGQMGGAALLGAGRALSFAGGPIGIAAALGITAAIAGFMAYKNAAEEAEARARAAFEEPAKAAEYFGVQIKDVGKMIEEANLSSIDEDLTGIDESLRQAVVEDYGALIEKVRNLNEGAGAHELSMAFSNMILSGMSAEQAREAIKAISVEAGEAGGEAFARASADGMLEAMTPEEAMNRVTSQFDPSLNQDLINEQRSAVAFEEQRLADLERRFALIANLSPEGIQQAIQDGTLQPGDTFAGLVEQINQANDRLDQMRVKLGELEKINPDAFVPVAEALIMGYGEDPDKAIQAMDDMIDRVNTLRESGQMDSGDVKVISDDIDEFMKANNPEQWALYGDSIDTVDEKMQAMSMTIAGIPLSDAINDAGQFDMALAQTAIDNKVRFDELTKSITEAKDALYEAVSEDLNRNLQTVDKNLADIDDSISKVERNLRKGTERLQENFELQQEASEDAIEGMQDEIDLIQEKIDKRREEMEDRIEDLEEEKDGIEEATDAYIKSLEKKRRADSFYANQRKTALSALQKLASGDVFGFLQERQQMSADAQDFAYDNTIKNIEDQRDREIDAIDETIEKERERQKEFEDNQQERIDLIQDQIDAERDLMDIRAEAHEQELEDFEKKKQKRLNDLQDAKQKEQQKRQDIQDIIDRAEAKEIISAEELTKVLGPELAKPHIEEQKAIIRTIYLQELKKDGATEQSALDAIRPLLQTMYAGPDRTQGGGMQFDNASIKDFLGLGAPIPGRAMGGPISGPGGPKSDVIPAMLSNGEYVIQASSVKKYGSNLMDAINTQKFAEGGPVGLKNSLSKWIPKDRLSFYSNWDGYGTWPGGKPSGIMMHHTAGVGPGVLEWMARNPDAGKPVVQAMVARNGVAHILAYGGTGWGAGAGGTEGSYAADIWEDKEYAGLKSDLKNLGGASNILWQIEVESKGLQKDFTATMFDTIARMSAAIKEYAGWPSFAGKIINHKDWAAASGPNRPGGQRGDTLYPLGLYQANANKIWEEGGGSTTGGTKPGAGRGRGAKQDIGRYMPSSGGAGANTQFGKASPQFVFGMQLPGKGEGGGGGGKPGGNGGSAPTGNVTFKNIPDGYTVDDANRTLGYIRAGGWPTKLQKLAWTIAMRESGGRNIYDTGDYGIFQLNKPTYGTQPWWTSDRKIQYDPEYNSSMAYRHVSSSGKNFLPWAMRVNKDGNYEWDWSYYTPRPSWADTTERRTAAFWNSWVQKAAGGYISGAGGPLSDSIPAMLSNGEYVIRADSVKKYGKDFLDSINSGRFGSTTLSLPEPEMGMSAAAGGFIGMARGGMVRSPSFKIPSNNISTVNIKENAMAASSSSNTVNNSSNVKIVINGSGKNAKSIANKVMEMINNSENARNHSRSIR